METIKIKRSDFEELYNVACSSWQIKFNDKLKGQLFGDTLEFDKSFLNEMRSACDKDQLKLFNKIFKDYVENEINIFDITTYSGLCKALKQEEITIDEFKKFRGLLSGIQINQMLGHARVKQLEKLFNGDWVADWYNHNQTKYYPWWRNTSSGWGDCGVGDHSYGCYGAAGFYKTRQIAEHVQKYFFKEVYSLILG